MEIGIYGDVDFWTLRKLAERLRDQLLNEENVTQVEMGNVPEYITHIEIPQHRLREYNITLGQVADIIRQSSEDVPEEMCPPTPEKFCCGLKSVSSGLKSLGR